MTIAVQLYWNYNNYLEKSQRVVNDIQISLNNAVEAYYSQKSKNSYMFFSPNTNEALFNNFSPKDSSKNKVKFKFSSLKISTDDPEEYKTLPILLDSVLTIDSIFSKADHHEFKSTKGDTNVLNRLKGKRKSDSINLIKGLRNVFISLADNSIDFSELDSIFSKELLQKGINTKTYFNYYVGDAISRSTKEETTKPLPYQIEAKTTYLKSNQKLLVFHDDVTQDALRKSIIGIALSFILSVLIISALFYLLKIINQQKELAAIKNDLISNITHEFKTPIATVSTAIEAIENFNVLEDQEKTKKYLAMSTVQLKKLHQMVEKLLETATLDSESLLLKKEPTDLVFLIEKLTAKHQLLASNKALRFSASIKNCVMNIDVFHFENAVSNLIDNAIKYGGDAIEIHINQSFNSIEISIADNGKGIEKQQHEKIFDKFYRVPKGNTHDVKGFGIGLYYTKKIIEKHEGEISITSDTTQTIFKIRIPND